MTGLVDLYRARLDALMPWPEDARRSLIGAIVAAPAQADADAIARWYQTDPALVQLVRAWQRRGR